MAKRVQVPTATKGFGYVGMWSDGEAGWWMPRFLSRFHRRKYPSDPNKGLVEEYRSDNRVYLCEITVRPVLDATGRPITRIVHGQLGAAE